MLAEDALYLLGSHLWTSLCPTLFWDSLSHTQKFLLFPPLYSLLPGTTREIKGNGKKKNAIQPEIVSLFSFLKTRCLDVQKNITSPLNGLPWGLVVSDETTINTPGVSEVFWLQSEYPNSLWLKIYVLPHLCLEFQMPTPSLWELAWTVLEAAGVADVHTCMGIPLNFVPRYLPPPTFVLALRKGRKLLTESLIELGIKIACSLPWVAITSYHIGG